MNHEPSPDRSFREELVKQIMDYQTLMNNGTLTPSLHIKLESYLESVSNVLRMQTSAHLQVQPNIIADLNIRRNQFETQYSRLHRTGRGCGMVMRNMIFYQEVLISILLTEYKSVSFPIEYARRRWICEYARAHAHADPDVFHNTYIQPLEDSFLDAAHVKAKILAAAEDYQKTQLPPGGRVWRFVAERNWAALAAALVADQALAHSLSSNPPVAGRVADRNIDDVLHGIGIVEDTYFERLVGPPVQYEISEYARELSPTMDRGGHSSRVVNGAGINGHGAGINGHGTIIRDNGAAADRDVPSPESQ